MSNQLQASGQEGGPLRIHELNIAALADFLEQSGIRTSQGKLVRALHNGHCEVLNDPARFKVLACGRRWGKCSVTTDTYTHIDGSTTTFKDLIGKTFEVYSYDENNKTILTDAYCEDNGIKSIYRIKTKYGLELNRTSNHPFFTGEGWKSVDDELQVGNRIFVPTVLPQEGTDRKDPKLVQLLAYLLADGCITQRSFMFCNDNKIIQDQFLNCLDGTYKIKKERESKDGSIYKEYMLHTNNSIYELIYNLDLQGKNSHTKFIPNWIKTCPNDQISLFLNRLYSCDGWASKGEIGYCSVSKKLINDVKMLLARLGIISNLETKVLRSGRWKGNTAYQLKIHNASEIVKFIDKVSILGKEKQLSEVIKNASNSFNTQIDTIPKEFCNKFADKLSTLISYTKQEKTGYGRIRPDRAAGRNRLLTYCDMFPEHFKEERKLIEMPGYWDEIVELTYEGEQETAGISVPGYHNYINDCLEHNTLLTSLMALGVLMQMNRRVWIVAPDYGLCEKVFRELYNILVTQLQIIRPGKPNGGRARNQKGDYYLQTPWGSVLEAKSLENPDSLAGEALDLVIVDEAALQPNIEDIWTQMLKPTLMDKEGSAIFISTPRGKNTFYKLYLNGQTGVRQRTGVLKITKDKATGMSNSMTDWSSFQKTSYDNPLLAATPEKSKQEIDASYREAITNGKLLSFKQEYLADFEAVADTCFPGFIEEPTEKYPNANIVDYNFHPGEGAIYTASDHNFAKPASTIFAQVNKNYDVVIFDELFTPHTTTFMQAQQISDKEIELNKTSWHIWEKAGFPIQHRRPVKFVDFICDISGNQVQLNGRAAWDDFEEILKKRPVGLKQPRDIGCNMIRQWLQFPQLDQHGRPRLDDSGEQVTLPKLFVSRNCVNLIYALSTATFQKGRNSVLKEDYQETPDGYEGLLDALRYLLVYLFHDRGRHFTLVDGF